MKFIATKNSITYHGLKTTMTFTPQSPLWEEIYPLVASGNFEKAAGIIMKLQNSGVRKKLAK